MNNSFRVVSLISSFNEEDIISQVIGHLIRNGIEVYLIDNRSTDNTVDEASQWLGKGLIAIEQYPKNPCNTDGLYDKYDWTGILLRKEELTREIQADWFIHHDADEIRESPWPGLTLKEAIRWVDTLGYNCIDTKLFNFPPTDDGFKLGDDPLVYFIHYEDGAEYDMIQLKCWKSGKAPINLTLSGGHKVQFENMRIFPIKFILLHYPIRGHKHGNKKVFAERTNRYLEIEKSKGWHIQYQQVEGKSHCFLRNPKDLKVFNIDEARLELMTHNNIIKYLEYREEKANREIYDLRNNIDMLQSHNTELESRNTELESRIGEMQNYITELELKDIELKYTKNSLSWRITAPLRKIYDFLVNLLGFLPRSSPP